MGWSVRGSVFPYKVGHPDSPTNRAARELGRSGGRGRLTGAA